MGVVGSSLLIALLTGCGGGAPEPVKEAPFDEVQRVALMEDHYTVAIAAHDAVIRADLTSFQSKLAELSEQALPAKAPTGWKARHTGLRTAAAEAASVEDLEQAGQVMGKVVAACGGCHAAMPKGPVYRKPEPPKGETELATKMLAHQWATERLWEGVTGPWDEAWTRGAATLATAEVFPEDAPKPLKAQEAAMRAVGVEAGEAAPDARPALYGKLLSTCAGCHVEAKVDLEGR